MLWAVWIIAFFTAIVAALFEWWQLFAIVLIVWLADSFVIRILWDRANNTGGK